MQGCPSLIVCGTGVNVVLQEPSDWKNTLHLVKTWPLTRRARLHLTARTCVDVVAVRCFPQSFHSCGDKISRVTSMQILLYEWIHGVRATRHHSKEQQL